MSTFRPLRRLPRRIVNDRWNYASNNIVAPRGPLCIKCHMEFETVMTSADVLEMAAPLPAAAVAKRAALMERLSGLKSVLVAYSGGTDSAFLAHAAYQALGSRMRAVLADSASLARSHFQDALKFAEENRIPLDIIHTKELEVAEYVKNDGARCFHCKHELFDEMEQWRSQLGFEHLAFGMNADDHGEYRPGHAAADEYRVIAPLAEVGLTKAEIREIARRDGLRIWDKPASACLSSRIEYGRPVTREALSKIEAAEEVVRALGFQQFRVRFHGELARIEISTAELPLALSPEMMRQFNQRFKALGFLYVTLDCEGYRSGSMNAVLPISAIQPAEHRHGLDHASNEGA